NNKIRISGFTAERYYFTPQQGVPTDWPDLQPGLVGVVSFRPNLAEVPTGTLDTSIVAFLRKAPPGSWVTIWHEANAPKKNINPDVYRAATEHVRRLVNVNKVPVKFVQILECYPVTNLGQDLTKWIVPKCHAYLLDAYQLHATQSPDDVFGSS